MKVQLSPKQQQLLDIITTNLPITKDYQNQKQSDVQSAFKAMKEAAHELHQSLVPKPKHRNYLIKNRGMAADDPEFYDHIHTVESLLEYLYDTTANDDPIDHTIGEKFDFRLYSHRWGHKDNYRLTRTRDGWLVNHLTYNGEDKRHEDMKVLYGAMEHESISFPRDVDSYLDSIWERAKEGLTHEEVQEMLNKVADWISETEMKAPIDILI